MINVNTIQRKGAVRIDVLLTREQVKILNDTGSLKIKMSKPMLKKYSIRDEWRNSPISNSFICWFKCGWSIDWYFSSGENCKRKEGSTPGSKIIGKT